MSNLKTADELREELREIQMAEIPKLISNIKEFSLKPDLSNDIKELEMQIAQTQLTYEGQAELMTYKDDDGKIKKKFPNKSKRELYAQQKVNEDANCQAAQKRANELKNEKRNLAIDLEHLRNLLRFRTAQMYAIKEELYHESIKLASANNRLRLEVVPCQMN